MWGSNLILYFEVAPAKECRGSGERNTDLSRRESRYLDCEARQIYGCFEMVLSPEAKQKQIYGCFEMVSPPRKQLNYK